MSKIKWIIIFTVIEITTFIMLMFVSLNGFKLNSIWFSIATFFVGLYAINYYFLYKLDSSLYYGVLLISLSLCQVYKFVNDYSFSEFYPIYFFCFAIANFSVFVRFRQNIHFKMFAILAFEAILLVTYKLNIVNFASFVAINTIVISLMFITLTLRIRRNLRRER